VGMVTVQGLRASVMRHVWQALTDGLANKKHEYILDTRTLFL